MGYLDRLKLETHLPKKLPKAPKPPNGSFDSSQGGHISEVEAELSRIVPLVVRAYDGLPEEEAEALQAALANPVEALQSYRLMAERIEGKSIG